MFLKILYPDYVNSLCYKDLTEYYYSGIKKNTGIYGKKGY
jgi:hypothetical protein